MDEFGKGQYPDQ